MVKSNKVGLLLAVERFAPIILAGLSLILMSCSKRSIVAEFAAENWKAEGLYSAIFAWASIQIGFAFGVYGFVVGQSKGFMEAIRNTTAMNRFITYVKRANVSSFLLTIFSIPLIVVSPDLKDPSGPEYALVSLWFSLFVWTFLTFLRIAYGFGHLSSVKDAPPFYGAGL